MTHRTTKSTWTAAILLGFASIAVGQTTPTFFSDPTFTTSFPASNESPFDWMGNIDLFRFISSEKPVESPSPPQSPSPAPNEQPPTDPTPTQNSGKSDLPTQPGWPTESANSQPMATDSRFVGAVNGSATEGRNLQPSAAHHAAGPAGVRHDDSANAAVVHGAVEHGSELLSHTAYATGNNRMFLQLDLLTWAISAPDISAIGDRASEGIVNVGGNSYFRENSLDTGFVTGNWTLGGRVDFGRIEEQRGWMGSVLFYRHQDQISANGVWFVPSDPDGLLSGYQDSNNDGIDDDVNNNQIYGRSGQDLGTPDPLNPGSFLAPFDGTIDQPAPSDLGDLVNWLVTFSTLTASNSVELTGFELVDVYRPSGSSARTLDWSWGLRYLEFREKFDVIASGGTLDTSNWNVDSDNDIIGPQVGVRFAANREWFRFTAEGRFLAGCNFQNDRLNGGIAMNATAGGTNGPVALEPNSFNSLQSNSQFSPVGEWRLEASYYASRWLAFRIGYTGMAIGGVSRASPKIAYALPSFGLSDVGSNETVLINGLNVGLEINR